jgi:hypothetical protein
MNYFGIIVYKFLVAAIRKTYTTRGSQCKAIFMSGTNNIVVDRDIMNANNSSAMRYVLKVLYIS